MADTETPIEEWKQAKTGREYVTVKGPGGGTIWRQGDESIDAARLRHATAQEAKRRQQAAPGAKERPKGKGRQQDKPPDIKAGAQAKPAKARPTPAQLAAAAELPLQVLGAFAGHQLYHCAWCAESMRKNAGAAAADLAKTTNPYLLNLLTWWHGLIAAFAGGDGLAQYVLPPLVHHTVPDPMFSFVAPFMGVPPKNPPHAHGHPGTVPPGGQPVPPTAASPMPPPGNSSPGGGTPLTPQQAAALAANPDLHRAVQAGDPRALAYLQQLGAQPAPAPPPPNPGAPPAGAGADTATERAALEAERARLQAAQALGARQAQAAAEAATGNGAAARVPVYRASDTLSPTQLRQMQAAAASSQGAGAIPNYAGGESATGTPSAPGSDSAASAGSPLPPEA